MQSGRHKQRMLLLAVLMLFSASIASLPAGASSCSLADHIRSANTNTSVGGCPTGTNHDIITLTEDITLSEALPPIQGTITIEGNGRTISGDYKYRIFDVLGGRLTINNLTLTKGRAKDEEDLWGHYGGAIRLRSGALTVNGSSFINNAANQGGAIAVRHSHPTLIVSNSSFVNNSASYYGGALHMNSGTVSITKSSFIDNMQTNSWQGGGGAIANDSGALSVSNSTFNGNRAYQGGALSITNGSTTLTHLTFLDNQAGSMEGHAIWLNPDDRLVDRRNRQVNLFNSVIGGGLPYGIACFGPLTQNIGNLIEDGTCGPDFSGAAALSALTGTPAYHASLDDSLTIDNADPRFCVETDQISTPRPQQGACDIGAIESMTARPAKLPPPSCSLSDKIIAANTDADAGGCLAGSGADTITLTHDIILREELPPVTSDITIEGNGQSISGDGKFRIFAVDGGKLTLKNLTLTEGRGSANGGAAWLKDNAELIVLNVFFSHNRAERGGAIATGGGDSAIVISQSRFMQNAADEGAGAIYIGGGKVEISDSIFGENTATAPGRGWKLEGGAISMNGGQLRVFNSSFHDNRANHGGAFNFEGGKSELSHLTLMNNVSTYNGGDGLQQRGGSVFLRNSIVAGGGIGKDCRGEYAELSGNFSEDGSCSPGFRGDVQLGELTGSPGHFPLLDGSPAIDAADARYCLETDQVGRARPQGGGCDIGAIESSSAGAAARLSPHPGLTTAVCSLSDLIIAANNDAVAGNCPAGYLADTIILTRHITLSAPLPPITSDITIEGNGYAIDGDKRFRIFEVDGGELQLSRLTLRNGSAPGSDGGAIQLRDGAVLNGRDLVFTGNSAKNGAAISAHDSSLNIDESQFLGNQAENRGAAVFIKGGLHSFHGGKARNNSAPGAPGPAEPRMPWLISTAHGTGWGYILDFSSY